MKIGSIGTQITSINCLKNFVELVRWNMEVSWSGLVDNDLCTIFSFLCAMIYRKFQTLFYAPENLIYLLKSPSRKRKNGQPHTSAEYLLWIVNSRPNPQNPITLKKFTNALLLLLSTKQWNITKMKRTYCQVILIRMSIFCALWTYRNFIYRGQQGSEKQIISESI